MSSNSGITDTILEEFAFGNSGRGRKGKYDWDAYFDGKVHKIDFAPGEMPKHFGGSAYLVARARGIGLRYEKHKDAPDSIYLQSYTLTPEEAARLRAADEARQAKAAAKAAAEVAPASTDNGEPLDAATETNGAEAADATKAHHKGKGKKAHSATSA